MCDFIGMINKNPLTVFISVTILTALSYHFFFKNQEKYTVTLPGFVLAGTLVEVDTNVLCEEVKKKPMGKLIFDTRANCPTQTEQLGQPVQSVQSVQSVQPKQHSLVTLGIMGCSTVLCGMILPLFIMYFITKKSAKSAIKSVMPEILKSHST
jgi:hypothetical protein